MVKLSYDKLHILVTGGAGFIGSNLCRQLLSQGHKVINIDCFDDFYDPEIKYRNIENEVLHSDYLLQKIDIRDEESVMRFFDKYKIDVIVHLAGLAGVRPSIANPEKYFQVNVLGTLNILNAARKHNINKIIFASSSSVYGNNDEMSPLVEDVAAGKMISPYAISKKSGEDLCYYFHKEYGINIIVLRFFTVYGPGQRPDLAIHKFVRLISNGETIPVYGEGDSLRDYTYIDDIVKGITATIDFLREKSLVYEIINLSGQKAIRLKDMIAQIEHSLGKKAKLTHLPMQSGDVYFTMADLTKAKKLLLYNPVTPFADGIQHFVDWFNHSFHVHKK